MTIMALPPAITGGAYGNDSYGAGSYGNSNSPAVPGSVLVLTGLTPASGAIVVIMALGNPVVVVSEIVSLPVVPGSAAAVPGSLVVAGTPVLPQVSVTAQAVAGSAAFGCVLTGTAATLVASAVTGTAATIVGIAASPAASAVQAAAGQVIISKTSSTSPAAIAATAFPGAVRVSAVAALPPAASAAQAAAGTAAYGSALSGVVAVATARAVAGAKTASVTPPIVTVTVPAGSVTVLIPVSPASASARAVAGSLMTGCNLPIWEAAAVTFAIAGQVHVSVFASSPPATIRDSHGVTALGSTYGAGIYSTGSYGTIVNPAVPGAVRVSESARLPVPVTTARAIAGQTSSSRKLTVSAARCRMTVTDGHVKVSGTAAGTTPVLHAVAVTGTVHAYQVVILDPEPAMITASAPGGTVIARRDIVITGYLSPQPDIDIQLVVN